MPGLQNGEWVYGVHIEVVGVVQGVWWQCAQMMLFLWMRNNFLVVYVRVCALDLVVAVQGEVETLCGMWWRVV